MKLGNHPDTWSISLYVLNTGLNTEFHKVLISNLVPHSYCLEVVSSHSYYLYMAPAVIGEKLRLPKLNYSVKITNIDSSSEQISYAFEKAE